MTAVETPSPADSSHGVQPKITLACGPRRARQRIVDALSARSDLATDFDSSLGDLQDSGSGVRHLIAYCESISPEQLEWFKELKHNGPDILIVAICESADRRTVRRLLDGGIDGLVFADQIEEALGPTVAAVFAGQMVVPRDMRDAVNRPSLSTRERQILAMLVTGLTNQEIGARMFLAESTVKSHLSSAYTKLGVRSRQDAATLILNPTEGLAPGILAITAA